MRQRQCTEFRYRRWRSEKTSGGYHWGFTAKFCVMPELLLTPVPLIRKGSAVDLKVIVNALALRLKTMPFTSFVEAKTSVVLEIPKVALSDGPSGTVVGVQLAELDRAPEMGLRFQVALPA
jgi:hypothetical protein